MVSWTVSTLYPAPKSRLSKAVADGAAKPPCFIAALSSEDTSDA
jgi:hypothetical protein